MKRTKKTHDNFFNFELSIREGLMTQVPPFLSSSTPDFCVFLVGGGKETDYQAISCSQKLNNWWKLEISILKFRPATCKKVCDKSPNIGRKKCFFQKSFQIFTRVGFKNQNKHFRNKNIVFWPIQPCTPSMNCVHRVSVAKIQYWTCIYFWNTFSDFLGW